MKYLYVIDHFVPFPQSEYGGVWNVIARDDEEFFDVVVSESGKRLDHYAQEYYEDAGNWWLIAAASGIGWWLQVPEGVVLKIPTDLEEVEDFIESIE